MIKYQHVLVDDELKVLQVKQDSELDKQITKEIDNMQTIEQKEKSLEEIVLEKGFESIQEFFSLVSQIDFSETALSVFNQWQDNDGSKVGLMKLLKLE